MALGWQKAFSRVVGIHFFGLPKQVFNVWMFGVLTLIRFASSLLRSEAFSGIGESIEALRKDLILSVKLLAGHEVQSGVNPCPLVAVLMRVGTLPEHSGG